MISLFCSPWVASVVSRYGNALLTCEIGISAIRSHTYGGVRGGCWQQLASLLVVLNKEKRVAVTHGSLRQVPVDEDQAEELHDGEEHPPVEADESVKRRVEKRLERV